mmetsp:Transcript_13692/g.31566  ORF Transcript_13692/g.31566 Transcript_13692/m.31566 type:complete len:201 (-) Transcript_13692:1583-2185(-)
MNSSILNSPGHSLLDCIHCNGYIIKMLHMRWEKIVQGSDLFRLLECSITRSPVWSVLRDTTAPLVVLNVSSAQSIHMRISRERRPARPAMLLEAMTPPNIRFLVLLSASPPSLVWIQTSWLPTVIATMASVRGMSRTWSQKFAMVESNLNLTCRLIAPHVRGGNTGRELCAITVPRANTTPTQPGVVLRSASPVPRVSLP